MFVFNFDFVDDKFSAWAQAKRNGEWQHHWQETFSFVIICYAFLSILLTLFKWSDERFICGSPLNVRRINSYSKLLWLRLFECSHFRIRSVNPSNSCLAVYSKWVICVPCLIQHFYRICMEFKLCRSEPAISRIPMSNCEIDRVMGISSPKYLHFDFKLIIQFQFPYLQSANPQSSSYWSFNYDVGEPAPIEGWGEEKNFRYVWGQLPTDRISSKSILWLFDVRDPLMFVTESSFESADTSAGNHSFDQSIITILYWSIN